jgi:two-component system, sensor histidine kinase and response regulator
MPPVSSTDLHVEATQRLVEALVESETRMRERIELLSEVVFEVAADGSLMFLNKTWTSITGFALKEALGQPLEAFFHEDDRGPLRAALMVADPRQGRQLARLLHREGHLLWVEYSVNRNQRGATVGVLADVTAEKVARDELAKLSTVASSTDSIVIVTCGRGLIEWVNQAFERRTGYTLAEVQGRKPGSFLQGPNTDPATVAQLRQAILQGHSTRAELLNYTRDRAPYWVSLVISPVFDDHGGIRNFVSVQSDVTERRLLEEAMRDHQAKLEERVVQRTLELESAKDAAERATRAKSAFVSTITHELRTPLNAIVGYNQLLAQGELSPRQIDYVEKSEKAAQVLEAIIEDVLDFSKIEAGAVEIEAVPFEIGAVLATVDAVTGSLAREKGLTFVTRTDPAVPPVLIGDRQRVTQILLNLTSNAVKFTLQGMIAIDVSVRAVAGERVVLELRVTDSGIGIAPEHVDRIFQPFQQADASTSRVFGGTGLGLAISRQLARMMDGDLRAASSVGHGSEFCCTLTLQVGSGATPIAADPAGKAFRHLHGARVLVAEDNEFNQEVARDILELKGVDVTLAGNGLEVLRILGEAEPFDVILMDIAMPGLDGVETTRRIRRDPRHDRTTIIALTANASVEDRQTFREAGMADAVSKPFRAGTLYEAIERALAHHPVVRPSSVDLDILRSFVGGDEAKVTRLVGRFIEVASRKRTDLRAAADRGDFHEAAGIAHMLKSSAGMIGATGLAEQCAALEVAREESSASIRDVAEATITRLDEVVEELRRAQP